MKLCKDCKWCVEDMGWDTPAFRLKYAYCGLPKNLSLVDGSPLVRCKAERDVVWFVRGCSHVGRHWEPRAS